MLISFNKLRNDNIPFCINKSYILELNDISYLDCKNILQWLYLNINLNKIVKKKLHCKKQANSKITDINL